jgi:hypothetical protein
LRDGKLDTANEIWQAKFAKARERYLSLIADSESDGASRDSIGVRTADRRPSGRK